MQPANIRGTMSDLEDLVMKTKGRELCPSICARANIGTSREVVNVTRDSWVVTIDCIWDCKEIWHCDHCLGIRGMDVTAKTLPQQSRLFNSKRYDFIQSPIDLNLIIKFNLS
jgi:hypothetical protein